jgi:uncharacterized protein YeaO (DUF488 family)
MKNIKTKRVYDKYENSDGVRILVDRLWPRGIKKEEARIDEWLKDIAPSDSLRKWYSHDPEKWSEFKKKYYSELKDKKEVLQNLMKKSEKDITLVYSSKELRYNNANALKEYLEKNVFSEENQ